MTDGYRRTLSPSRGARAMVVALALGSIAAVTAAQPAAAITIDEIQVTQGIQTAGNTVPLVADRSTAVRVRLHSDQGEQIPAEGFVGRLQVFVGTQEVTGDDPSGADGVLALNGNLQGQRGFVPLPGQSNSFAQTFDENETLNFEIPAPTGIRPSSGLSSSDLHFVVFVQDRAVFRQNPSTPPATFASVDNLTVIDRGRPQIYAFPVRWGADGQEPDASMVAAGRGDAMLRGVVPIDDSTPTATDLEATRYEVQAPLTVSRDPITTNNSLEFPPHVFIGGSCNDVSEFQEECNQFPLSVLSADQVITQLNTARQMFVQPGATGANRLTFVMGWLRDALLVDHGGLAQVLGGKVAYSGDSGDQGQLAAAHELIHLVGLPHNNEPPEPVARLAPNVGWDVGARLDANPPGGTAQGGNGVAGRLKLTTFGDLMNNPGERTASAWINEANYRTMLADQTLASRRQGGRLCDGFFLRLPRLFQPGILSQTAKLLTFRACPQEEPPGTEPTELVAEVRYREGDPAACVRRTDTGRCVPRRGGARIAAAGQIRTLRVRVPRSVLHADRFDGKPAPPETPGSTTMALPVPVGSVPLSARVTDRGRTVMQVKQSRAVPLISIASPRRGGRLRGRTTLRWSARDPDSPARDVRYFVSYSDDGGRNWRPLAVDLTSPRLTVDARRLRPSKGRGAIRIFANDGLNTSSADVTGLTIG